MKSFITILSILLLSIFASAQEGPILMPMDFKPDSTQLELDRQIEYNQLISGQLPNYLSMEKIELPEFDYKSEYAKRYSFDYNMAALNTLPLTGFSMGMMGSFYSPFYQNATVYSQAAYKVGDKFTFGGFSYGTNSMMLPPPAPGLNNFNGNGSTMFMQYKVGKNFKIETRVNVSQGPGY